MSSGTMPEQQVPEENPRWSARESAPSAMTEDTPTVARMIGLSSLLLATLAGLIALIRKAMGSDIPAATFIALGAGLLGLIYHAARDGDVQIRRSYGLFGYFWLLLGLLFAVIPGGPENLVGYRFLPNGIMCLVVSWIFLMAFSRHENEQPWLDYITLSFLLIGGILGVGSFLYGVLSTDFLVGSGILLNLIGLAFLNLYVTMAGSTAGRGYQVALGMGGVGALVGLYGLLRSALPTLTNPANATLLLTIGGVGLGLGLVGYFLTRRLKASELLKPAAERRETDELDGLRNLALAFGLGGLVVLGFGLLGLYEVVSLASERGFLIPAGVVLVALGVLWASYSIGICSDNTLVVMTRRELSSYFYSPVAYLVLLGMSMVGWLNYKFYTDILIGDPLRPTVLTEPILRYYLFQILPVMAVIFVVPAVTMRLFSEERRTGTLEVLMTTPVSESMVVLSKFLASLIFFVLLWVPWGLYLISLRLEGGQPFDYKPLLSFYLALACTGAAMVAIGVFFSSLTRNQIIAAVLTFLFMLLGLFFYLAQDIPSVSEDLRTVFGYLSFLDLWEESLQGRLYLRKVLLHLSIATLFVFLTVKILEARKWL